MKYRSGAAFRAALLHKIRAEATARGLPAARLQLRFLFERLWLRLERAFPTVIIKGGAALEFRLELARTTRDLDLSVRQVAGEQLLEKLQEACQEDYGDFLTFQVKEGTPLENEAQRYEGRRLSVSCYLDNQILFSQFGLDIAVGEPSRPPDLLEIEAFPPELGTLKLPVYSVSSHIAEKLHAYTLPRNSPNSRVKDLPDIALLAKHQELEAGEVRAALQLTFTTRATHELSPSVPPAPVEWAEPYRRMSAENQLPWPDIEALHQSVAAFLDPLLGTELPDTAAWDTERWCWISERGANGH